MVPLDIANLALAEVGNRIQIASFTDGSPAANVANLFYTPKTQMLLRTANWDFARAQAPLAVWKAVIVNGVVSANPPPQPWQYSYLRPTDCLKARFIQPTLNIAPAGTPLTTSPTTVLCTPPVPTAIPFVVATDFDANGNPIGVILTNLPGAQLIYTRDLSQAPALWDSLFLNGASALLASYFINALARNKAQMDDQIAIAKSVIDQARVANGNEAIANVDHVPDWIRVRQMAAVPWAWNQQGPAGVSYSGGWDSTGFPDGSFY